MTKNMQNYSACKEVMNISTIQTIKTYSFIFNNDSALKYKEHAYVC